MLGAQEKSPAELPFVERIEAWTRERFELTENASIRVSEKACSIPGGPPLETTVAFWTAGEKRHEFAVFKPAAEVRLEDLPPNWMKNALVSSQEPGCSCS